MQPLPQKLAKAFQKIATSGEAVGDKPYIVGGFVRDWLMGLPFDEIPDLDVICEFGHTEKLVNDICQRFGLGQPEVYDYSGTLMLIIDGYKVEFQSSTNANVHFPVKSDLVKMGIEPNFFNRNIYERDFTIDTLCYDLIDNEILDVTGKGYEDLEARVLDTPIDPVRALEFNPFIVLRGIKFMCKLGLNMADRYEDALPVGIRLLSQSLEKRSEKHTKELINKIFEYNEQLADELFYKYGLYDILPMPEELIEKSIKKHMLGIQVQMASANSMISFDYCPLVDIVHVGETVHRFASSAPIQRTVQKAICDLYLREVVGADTKLMFLGEDSCFSSVREFITKRAAVNGSGWLKNAYAATPSIRVYDRFQKRKEYRDRKRREQKRDRVGKLKSWRDFRTKFMI